MNERTNEFQFLRTKMVDIVILQTTEELHWAQYLIKFLVRPTLVWKTLSFTH